MLLGPSLLSPAAVLVGCFVNVMNIVVCVQNDVCCVLFVCFGLYCIDGCFFVFINVYSRDEKVLCVACASTANSGRAEKRQNDLHVDG